MKKASFLILPLVNVLVACVGQSTPISYNDIFDEVRNRKYDAEFIKYNESFFKKYDIISRYDIIWTTYTKDGVGWEQTSEIAATTYTETILDKSEPNSSIAFYLGVSADDGSYSLSNMEMKFFIRKVNGTFTIITSDGIPNFYIQSASEIYQRALDAIYIWNTSFYAGALHFLIAREDEQYISDKALNYLTTNFTAKPSEEFETNEVISGGDPTLSYFDVVYDRPTTYCIKEYESVYYRGLLLNYKASIRLDIQIDANTKYSYDITIQNKETAFYYWYLD